MQEQQDDKGEPSRAEVKLGVAVEMGGGVDEQRLADGLARAARAEEGLLAQTARCRDGYGANKADQHSRDDVAGRIGHTPCERMRLPVSDG